MHDTITILLVDDESRNLDALESILEDPAYRLLRAEDADKALRLLLENDVAAIVLDIKMPTVSGFELAQLIKGTRKYRQIPIVFLTAYLLDDKDILTGYGTGAVDYLTKPVNPQILRHKVAVFAELFRKTRALAELNENLEARVKERTSELAKSEAALREGNAQKDRFLATLAHELRNPLAPLRTGLDLLLHHPERPPAMERTLSTMNRQLSHLVRLIDDLLDVSRISHGKLEMRRETIDLMEVIERAVETAAPEFQRRKQVVTIRAEGPVAATVDATRIAQIVGNLLNNASKHSAVGAAVRIHFRQEEDTAVIQVVDEGAGIPPGQIGCVFDMFTTIERSSPIAVGGLGIGLALSRRLAELHGGTLTAESAGEEKGATFTLSLPVAGSTAVSVVEQTGAPRAPANAAARSTLKIVVVEDNEDSAEMMTLWIESLGHEVRVARTGSEGVELILSSSPDIVLCDIGLPEMDGVEVCRQVVEAAMPAPPVMVALTGWGMDQDRKRTREAGFLHHLVKPFDPDKLRAMLEAIGAKR